MAGACSAHESRRFGLAAFVAILVALPGVARAADYHHVHLASPNVPEAVQWYIANIGCTAMNRPDACQIGTTQLIFANRKPDAGSEGSGADHIGFSFADLTAKMRAFQAAGVKVVTQPRDVPGLFKVGFIEDPWGTRIEVVEDKETLGFHHIHLISANPDATLKWYQNVFGGQSDRLKGRMDGLRYGTVWLLAAASGAERPAPSLSRAIYNVAWEVPNVDEAVAALKSKGVKVNTEPRSVGTIRFAYVEDPDGVQIGFIHGWPR